MIITMINHNDGIFNIYYWKWISIFHILNLNLWTGGRLLQCFEKRKKGRGNKGKRKENLHCISKIYN